MINVLIADDNIYYAKSLMDYINNNSNDVRVCNITIDGEETLNTLEKSDIDVFLLDLKMPIYTGKQVLDMLSLKKKDKYNKSCIIISGDISCDYELLNKNPIVYKFLNKSLNMSEIIENINELFENKKRM